MSLRSGPIFVLAALTPAFAQQIQDRKGNQHHRYKVVDLGTLGGPATYVENPLPTQIDLTRRSIVAGGSELPVPDPFPQSCFLPECFVAHAFHWEGGQLTDLGVLPANPRRSFQQACLTCGWSSFVNWIDATGTTSVGLSQTGWMDPLTGQPQQLATSVNKRGEVTGAALNDIADSFANLVGGFTFFPQSHRYAHFSGKTAQ